MLYKIHISVLLGKIYYLISKGAKVRTIHTIFLLYILTFYLLDEKKDPVRPFGSYNRLLLNEKDKYIIPYPQSHSFHMTWSGPLLFKINHTEEYLQPGLYDTDIVIINILRKYFAERNLKKVSLSYNYFL